MLNPIRVFISDPRPVVRAGLYAFLNTCEEFLVVGECSGLAEIRGLVEKVRPNVVLVGQAVHELDWTGLVSSYIADPNSVRCLLLSRRDLKPHHYINAFRAGFRGIYLKESELDALKAAVCAVHAGSLWCDQALTSLLLETLICEEPAREAMSKLSGRQRQIVELVLKGERNQEIARRLFASEATIARELTLTYRKLNVSSRMALITQLQGQVN